MFLLHSHTVHKNVLEEKYESSHAQLLMKFLLFVFFLAFVISGGVSAPFCRAPSFRGSSLPGQPPFSSLLG